MSKTKIILCERSIDRETLEGPHAEYPGGKRSKASRLPPHEELLTEDHDGSHRTSAAAALAAITSHHRCSCSCPAAVLFYKMSLSALWNGARTKL